MIDGRFLVPLEDSLSLFNMLLPLAMAGHRCSLKRRHENSFICHDCILGMGVSIQDWTKWIRFFQLWIQGSMGLTKMFQSYGSHENWGRVPSWVLFWEAKLMDKSRQCSRTTGICWDLGDYISSQRDSRVWKTTFARLALHLQAPDGLLPPHEELLGSGKLWHFEGSNVTGDGGGPCPKTLPKTPKSPQVSEVFGRWFGYHFRRRWRVFLPPASCPWRTAWLRIALSTFHRTKGSWLKLPPGRICKAHGALWFSMSLNLG